MSNGPDTRQEDVVDPDIRRFVNAINGAYAEHADASAAGMESRRMVAEIVRKPWREGGPQMAETSEFDLDGIRLRLHRPVADEVLPVILYIHGGGWMLFSIDTHDRLMREYAARAGVAVLGIDYSLAPENRFPAALEECSAALDWIAENAGALRLDAQHILIGGDSAGANLSVATCLLRRSRGQIMPAGMVLNYGAYSPEHLPSYDLYGGGDFPLETEEMDVFWENYVNAPEQLADPLVNVLNADVTGLPPAFIAVAECDILADCNYALAEQFRQAKVPVQLETYRGATHSFLEAMSISPLASRALDEQAAWIRETVAQGA